MPKHREGKAIMGLVGIITSIPLLYMTTQEPEQPKNTIETYCEIKAAPNHYEKCLEQEMLCLAAPGLFCEQRNYQTKRTYRK